MAEIQIKVTVDLHGLNRGRTLIAEGLAGGGGSANPLRAGFRQAVGRYEAFARRRFVRFSRGGGDWAPLSASTIRARNRRLTRKPSRRGSPDAGFSSLARTRRGGREILAAAPGGARVAILRDRGILFGALTIGAPGNDTHDVQGGIRYGLGGPARHPGGPTIAQIAEWHNEGAGHNPRRVIIADPDKPTFDRMVGDIAEGVRKCFLAAGSEVNGHSEHGGGESSGGEGG